LTDPVDRPIRVALIGYGTAGSVLHAPLIATTAGLELGAIVTTRRTRQRDARAAYPEATILADVGAVWRGGFDLVVLATASGAHAELADQAITAGVAVVVDKPLATSAAAAERIVRRASACDVPLTVFQNRRWDSDFLTLRKVLAGGRLGRPIRLEARFEAYQALDPAAWQESPDPDDGGGVLIDLGSHRIDQATVLFGAPRSVYAELRRRRPGAAVEDDAFVSLTHANGVTCHLWLSRAAHAGGPGFRMLGSDAAFEIDGTDPQWEALARGDRPGGVGWGRQTAVGRVTSEARGATSLHRVRPAPGDYQGFYAAVRDALLHGTPMPVDPSDAVAVLRVIEGARASAARGRRIDLDHGRII
jgi:scyllo-inositol 2-dehydrogenase (NADP+)